MTPSTLRRAHKWLAVTGSLVLLSWIVSGFVMVVPYRWLAAAARLSPATDGLEPMEGGGEVFRDFQVSIPEAIAALEQQLGRAVAVRSVGVTTLEGRPVYEIGLAGDAAHLVDGRTGSAIEIDRAWVRRLARGSVPAPGSIVEIVRIDQRELAYSGRLPAYKVVFADPAGYVVYVSETGEVQRTSWPGRLYRRVTSLHELEPLRHLLPSPLAQTFTLLFFAGLSFLVVISGLALALPGRRRRRGAGSGSG